MRYSGKIKKEKKKKKEKKERKKERKEGKEKKNSWKQFWLQGLVPRISIKNNNKE